jgi:hypothetical protein
VKPRFLYDPLREIDTYRTILHPHHFSVPTFYGADVKRRIGAILPVPRICSCLEVDTPRGAAMAPGGTLGRRIARSYRPIPARTTCSPWSSTRSRRGAPDIRRRPWAAPASATMSIWPTSRPRMWLRRSRWHPAHPWTTSTTSAAAPAPPCVRPWTRLRRAPASTRAGDRTPASRGSGLDRLVRRDRGPRPRLDDAVQPHPEW